MTEDGKHSGETREVWLLLAREGGRWTAREASDALGDDFDSVSQALHRMGNRGAVKRYPKGPGAPRVSFGVTRECRVPQGVTVADMAALGIVKVES